MANTPYFKTPLVPYVECDRCGRHYQATPENAAAHTACEFARGREPCSEKLSPRELAVLVSGKNFENPTGR